MGDLGSWLAGVLATGATAAASDAASAAIKGGYARLKTLVTDRLKGNPDSTGSEYLALSPAGYASLAGEFDRSGVAADKDVLGVAGDLANMLSELPTAEAEAMGLDIEDLRACDVGFGNIVTSGTAIRIRRTTVDGDFEVDGFKSGVRDADPKN